MATIVKHLKERKKTVKKSLIRDRWILSISIVFFLSTFVLSRIFPLLSDSASHITRSQFILQHHHFPYAEFAFNQADAYVYPPLFHILGAASKYITGFYTVIPALSGAISIYLSFKLVSLWYDRETGLLTAIGVGCIPFFFLWSSRMYVESTITAAFLAVFYLYFLYKETDDRNYLYFSFMIGGLLAALKTYGPLASIIVFLHLAWENRTYLENTILNTWKPVGVGVILSLLWPLRNFIRTGSPIPKFTGIPFAHTPVERAFSGIYIFIPTLTETQNFLAMTLGVIPVHLVAELGRIHPILPTIWYIGALMIVSLFIYGARYEKDNTFIWIWILSLIVIYEIMRIKSGGAVRFKYRHFVTLTPVFGLFLARTYQHIQIRDNLKRGFFLLLILGLFLQMFTAVTVRVQFAGTAWPPMINWTQENIPKDDIIYSPGTRAVAYQLNNEYKVIGKSHKPGYINPNNNLASELKEKAGWVILRERDGTKDLLPALDRLEANGVVRLENKIDTKRKMFYGEIGVTWYIYSVTQPRNN